MEVISKTEAIEKGLKYYFTGLACAKGHLDKRTVSRMVCWTCHKLRVADWQKRNREKVKDYDKKYKEANLEKITKATKLRWAKWKIENPEKVKISAKKTYEKTKHLKKFYLATRRAKKLKATPSWANKNLMKEIYETCPKDFQVDHIIPLTGKDKFGNHIVCGLHTEDNLQHLPKIKNQKKSFKFTSYTEIEGIKIYAS